MAKATKATNTPPSTAPANTGAPSAPTAPKQEVNDLFIRVFQKDAEGKVITKDGKPVAVAPTTKLAPQAMVILNGIEAAGEKGIRRKDLISNITGILVTRQPVGRIVSYYQKELVASGAVVRENPPVEATPAA